jgi:hypothetical protein
MWTTIQMASETGNSTTTLIINNITFTEMVHISQCKTAKAMWDSLEAVHESKGHQTIVSMIHNLFHTSADNNTNISEHLNKLKQYWEHINLLNDKDFKISTFFSKSSFCRLSRSPGIHSLNPMSAAEKELWKQTLRSLCALRSSSASSKRNTFDIKLVLKRLRASTRLYPSHHSLSRSCHHPEGAMVNHASNVAETTTTPTTVFTSAKANARHAINST